MLSKGNIFLRYRNNVRIIFNSQYSTIPKVQTDSDSSTELVGKPKREPMMKNVLVGIVDELFFQYPEPENNEQSKNFQNLIKAASNLDANLSTTEKFNKLAKSGLFRCNLSPAFGGIEISNSEILKLYEELKLEPSQSFLLETQYSLIIPTILNHGSDIIKEKYLSKLISGECSGAYALSEENSSDPTSIKTTVIEEDDCFIINGEKIWVTNAENAEFFLVFATHSFDNRRTSVVNDVSVFLVEKNENLTIEKHKLLGLNECGISKVTFNNVKIPKSNLLGTLGSGYKIATEGFTKCKPIVLGNVLVNLKYFISSVVKFLNSRKMYPIDLKDSEIIKNKFADVIITTYAYESMLYLTSGISDKFDVDNSFEIAILQSYALERGIDAVSQCMNILGARAYDDSYSFDRIWCDLKGLSLGMKTVDLLKFFISMTGMDHAGKKLNDDVRKSRNPFNFPGFVLKKVWLGSRHAKDSVKLNLKLYLNLHPRLKKPANQTEYCILRLQFVIEALLTRHGSELVKRQIELQRIADIIVEIYSMLAVLSRASHSYCTGKKFCDQEINLAVAHCFISVNKVKKIINDIMYDEMKLKDMYLLDISTHILNNNSYCFEHPIIRSIV